MVDAMPGTILIAAGGTGGHVYPALAVAEELRQRHVPVVWLGTRSGLESRVIPAAGIDFEWIDVVGLRGTRVSRKMVAPLHLLRSVWQAWNIFRRRRPSAMLGMGGYVAGPAAVVALIRRVPLVIHEQNSVAGLTNRLLVRYARRVFTAFPAVFEPPVKSEQVGNPVRHAIESLPHPTQRQVHADAPRLLVLGGSRGARTLNRQVPLALALCRHRFVVRHQCGVADLDATRALYADHALEADVSPYIEAMSDAYAVADLVVCRAGAMTVSELTAAGLASVLVPYPYAVDDHQTGNAEWLVSQGAAELLPESRLTPESLARLLDQLAADHGTTLQMSCQARSLHRPGAAERVANALQEVSI